MIAKFLNFDYLTAHLQINLHLVNNKIIEVPELRTSKYLSMLIKKEV